MNEKRRMRMIFGNIISVLIAACLLLTAVSCEDPSADIRTETGSVTISLADETKGLHSVTDVRIVKYIYNAEPLFDHPYLTGKTGGFVMLGTEGVNPIGQMSQGEWIFTVKALNSAGHVLAKGSSRLFIVANQDNTVSISLDTDEDAGKGNVKITFDSYRVSSSGASALISYSGLSPKSTVKGVQTVPQMTAGPDGKLTFSSVIANLNAGFYDFTFTVLDNGVFVAGEQLVVQVVPDETAVITGSLSPVAEKEFIVSVDTPLYIDGKIDSNVSEKVNEGKNIENRLELGTEYTFTWKDTEDATTSPDYYIWALDGVIDDTNHTSSYRYGSASYGEHRLSVLGMKKANGKDRELGSATARILIPRRTANITFRAGEGTFADGSHSVTIYQDAITDPILPGGTDSYDGINPIRPGYYLTAWRNLDGEDVVTITRGADGTYSTVINDSYACEGDVKLDAIWVKDRYAMNIHWGSDVTAGGVAKPETETIEGMYYGTELYPYLKTPVKAAFGFQGFWTEPDGRGEQIRDTDVFDAEKHSDIYVWWKYTPLTVRLWLLDSDYRKFLAGGSVTPYRTITVGTKLKYASLPEPHRQGYVFKGWYGDDGKEVTASTVVTKDVDHSLIARWEEGAVPVKFDLLWETPTAEVLAEMSSFSDKKGALGSRYGALPFDGKDANSIRANYQFQGWYDSTAYSMRIYSESVCTTNSEHTLYAKWRGAQYTVTFSESGTSKTVRYLEPYGNLPEMRKFGFEFLGWYTCPLAGGEQITADSIVTSTGDHTLYPRWKRLYSPISFETAGGSLSDTSALVVYYDDLYTHALVLSSDESAVRPVNGNQYSPCHDEIVSGTYNENPALASYRIRSYEMKPLPTSEKVGYSFTGWKTDYANDASLITAETRNTSVEAHKLYAMFVPHDYNVTFISEGSEKGKKTVTYDAAYGTLLTPEKKGYNFSGWYMDEAFAGDRILSTTVVSRPEDHSLFAKWTIKTIQISFDTQGGKAVDPIKRQWNTAYGTLPTTTRYGYNFVRWTDAVLDGNGNTVRVTVNPTDIVTKEMNYTLQAEWSPKTVSYTLDPAGGTVNGSSAVISRTGIFNSPYKTLSSGGTAVFPTPVKTGYDFLGWYDDAGVKVESDQLINREDSHVITARWSAKAVQVTYYPNSGSVTGLGNTSKTVYYDGTLGSCPATYTFDGWIQDGWYYDQAFTRPAGEADVINTTDPISLYLKWVDVTVTYHYSTAEDSHSYIIKDQFYDRIWGVISGYYCEAGPYPHHTGYYSCYVTINGVPYDTVRIEGQSDSGMFFNTNTFYLYSATPSSSAASGTWTAPRTQQVDMSFVYNHEVFSHNIECPAYYLCNTCGGAGVVDDVEWRCDGHPYTYSCSGCKTKEVEVRHSCETYTVTYYCNGNHGWYYCGEDIVKPDGTATPCRIRHENPCPDNGKCASRSRPCSICGGKGYTISYEEERYCDGDHVGIERHTPGCYTVPIKVTCSNCNGACRFTCQTCMGTGYRSSAVRKSPTLTVTKNGSPLGGFTCNDTEITEQTCPVCSGNTTVDQGGYAIACVYCGATGKVSDYKRTWTQTITVNKGDVIAYSFGIPQAASYTCNGTKTESLISTYSSKSVDYKDVPSEFSPYTVRNNLHLMGTGNWLWFQNINVYPALCLLSSSDGAKFTLPSEYYTDMKFSDAILSNGSFTYNDFQHYWLYPGYIYERRMANGEILSDTPVSRGIGDTSAPINFTVDGGPVSSPSLIWTPEYIEYSTDGSRLEAGQYYRETYIDVLK